jgi:hypothetical protein
VVTADGSVDAANRAGLERLATDSDGSIRRELQAAASGAASEMAVDPIDGGERFLCERE